MTNPRALPSPLRRLAGLLLAFALVAVSPAAAQLLHEAAEHAGIAYAHTHGRLIHSHPHSDGHHASDGFASELIPVPGDAAPVPVTIASAPPAAAPALSQPSAVSFDREGPPAARPQDAKRAPPGARAPPAASAVFAATLA